MIELWELLAQATQTAPATPAPRPPDNPLLSMFLPIALMIAVFYIIMLRPQQRERKKLQEMLNNIKRNDRVETIGGILGTVVDVREREVVLKVDENSNVKMRFNRGAIKAVMAPSPENEAK